MHTHKETLARVRAGMGEGELAPLAELFKLFGDPTRLKILSALSISEMCVCAVAELLGMSQPAASYQLKVLKEGNLVDCRREGKTVFYFLADDHVHTMIGQGLAHVKEGRE